MIPRVKGCVCVCRRGRDKEERERDVEREREITFIVEGEGQAPEYSTRHLNCRDVCVCRRGKEEIERDVEREREITFIVLMIARVKATPQNILPAASTAAMCTIGPSRHSIVGDKVQIDRNRPLNKPEF